MAHEKEFIQHLSKEIETQTNAIMTFRTRIGFTVFLGPFILLGSLMVRTKEVPRIDIEKLTPETTRYLFLLAGCYLVLAIFGGLIEQFSWVQSNRWRTLIASLVGREDVDPKSKNVRYSHMLLIPMWVASFLLFFATFVVIVLLMSSLFGAL